MDDAQKRAQAFNAEARIAELEEERTQLLGTIGSLHDQFKEKDRDQRFDVEELEAEIARLRRALKQIRDLDQSFRDYVRASQRIAILALAPQQKPKNRRGR